MALDGESGAHWIVCHNPVEAERDKLRRDQALERLTAELERSKTSRARNAERRKAGNYKNLLEAERGFRDVESTLELRPVFHRVEPRIPAHVLLCWLALLLIRVAERRTGLTWRRIELELSRLHAVT